MLSVMLRHTPAETLTSKALRKRMFERLKQSKEDLFTNIVNGGLLLLLNGDGQGRVHTEELAEDGTKPDHILYRLLGNGMRMCAVVENKFARPTKETEVVEEVHINEKMDEAIRNLAGYYATHAYNATVMLAVVYAPSTGPPASELSPVTCEKRKKKKHNDPFGATPVYKITVRINLGCLVWCVFNSLGSKGK
eukprot:gb/GECG01009653.1/.p1 GENE.gb/GECG01009653.1/~~gb/GECG01009653.1/.p1  ORF type:complete len:193 (+),score=20.68 gb/GECG01009653.1/:1-579(+)